MFFCYYTQYKSYICCEFLAAILSITLWWYLSVSLQLALSYRRNKHCKDFTSVEMDRFMCTDKVCHHLAMVTGHVCINTTHRASHLPDRSTCMQSWYVLSWFCRGFPRSWHFPRQHQCSHSWKSYPCVRYQEAQDSSLIQRTNSRSAAQIADPIVNSSQQESSSFWDSVLLFFILGQKWFLMGKYGSQILSVF